TYKINAIIPVKIKKKSPKTILYSKETNPQLQKKELDLLSEIRKKTRIRKKTLKRRITSKYNQKIIQRNFTNNDLILIQNNIETNRPGEKKLTTN
ncbi:hypothetical protein DF186_14180, partial [Enterococcus hirae]